MRKRILTVLGVIALAGVLVMVIFGKQTPRITARLLDATNTAAGTYRFVVVSNTTDVLHVVQVWSEYKMPGGEWSREYLGTERGTLWPQAAEAFAVRMPTRGKQRLTLIYGAARERDVINVSADEAEGWRWRHWLWLVRTTLGMKPSDAENRLHVQVE